MPPTLQGQQSSLDATSLGGQTLMRLSDSLTRHSGPWEGTSAEASGKRRRASTERRGPGLGQTREGTQCHVGLAEEEGTLPSRSAARELQDKGREAWTVRFT